jgi:hypothetical protein
MEPPLRKIQINKSGSPGEPADRPAWLGDLVRQIETIGREIRSREDGSLSYGPRITALGEAVAALQEMSCDLLIAHAMQAADKATSEERKAVQDMETMLNAAARRQRRKARLKRKP